MTKKENQERLIVDRKEFIGVSATVLLSVILGRNKLSDIWKGLQMMFPDPQPPSDVELPPSLEETLTSSPEPTAEAESTQEILELGAEPEPTPEPSPTLEPSPTPETRSFNPETDTRLHNIDLTRPIVMDVPHPTGHAGGWGSLRYDIIPSFIFGDSWTDPKNAEAVFNYENFSYGTDDAIVVPTKKGGFILMLHTGSWNGVLLAGDVWGNAVDNHLDPESDREIVGKSLSFYQDYRENRLLLTAYNALKVPAHVFNGSFKVGSESHPMACDMESMGVPGDGPGKIHFIACAGDFVDDEFTERYVLSWHSSDLAAIFGSWLPQTV